VGAVWGMPGMYASDGEARDLMLGTSTGRKIYFGKHKTDAWIQSGSGDAWFAGSVTIKKRLMLEAAGQKLRVGEYAGLPGLYSSDDAPRDLMLGVAKDKKVYLGSSTGEAYFTAGAGSLWLKGSLEAHNNVYVYAEKQRLRVGSINGILVYTPLTALLATSCLGLQRTQRFTLVTSVKMLGFRLALVSVTSRGK